MEAFLDSASSDSDSSESADKERQHKERIKGECVLWKGRQKFGFIRMDDGEEVFVHSNDLQDTECLESGDRVEFEVGVNFRKTGKNSQNIAVRVIKIAGGSQKKKTDWKKISKTGKKITVKGNYKKGAEKMKSGSGKGKLQKAKKKQKGKKNAVKSA